MSVVDDGSGIDEPAERHGMGLRIMKYRAGMIGGILRFAKDRTAERSWSARSAEAPFGRPTR